MDPCKDLAAKHSVRQLQEGQHYQLVNNPGCSTDLSCSFTWKIDKVQQKRMSTLQSRPFFTAQNAQGYKICLLLFMDGDGSGQGTHISFYAALMRGENDAKLQWPFRQKVKLVLVSQCQQHQDIVQWFQPDPVEFDGSFWHPSPHCDMNVGFGCPQFAPVSVLNDPAYVKNDTMILKCISDNNY